MKKTILLILLFAFLSACSAQGTQEESFLLTVVAGTQEAAALQTEMASRSLRATSTPAALLPTITVEPTATTYIFVRDTPTLTPTIYVTETPDIRTEWAEWKTGEVVSMRTGGGTNKIFYDLVGLQVMVVRQNGVKLRSIPSKAIGGPIEERGSAFTLTGVMNINHQYGWLFAQVIAADGNKYWVGGSEDDDSTNPTFALVFYYPSFTVSPTPASTPIFTPIP